MTSDCIQIEKWAWLACAMEATATKPGNVHPGASFVHLTYSDFIKSANAIAPIVASAPEVGVGRAILEAVSRTRSAVGQNSNLGIILLLTPLAAVPSAISLRDGIGDVLQRLDQTDADLVYQAIRTAQPGGMGQVDEEDVSKQPTVTLLAAMQLAADRDSVAAQYATGYRLIFDFGVRELAVTFDRGWHNAVVGLHLRLMARNPDTLIARKCGWDEARQSAARAQAVLDAGWPDSALGQSQCGELDNWLRAGDNRRNPGTTADLVTACLFAALREGQIAAPPIEAIGHFDS